MRKPRLITHVSPAALALVASPFLHTWLEEWRIRNPRRLAAELGYPIPSHARIVDSSASLYAIADNGVNYTWTIASDESLLPWASSVGQWEHGRSYKVVRISSRGREETSYITIEPDERRAEVATFRP